MQLNRRITLQSRGAVDGEYGQVPGEWANVFADGDGKVWAGIQPLNARELLAAQATQSETSHKITVRYRAEYANPTTVTGWRALYNGRVFNISGAINRNEGNHIVDLLAAEGLNNG